MTLEELKNLGACKDALKFVGAAKSWKDAIETCDQIGWFEWLFRATGVFEKYQSADRAAHAAYQSARLEAARKIAAAWAACQSARLEAARKIALKLGIKKKTPVKRRAKPRRATSKSVREKTKGRA